jgi:signal transduction histidine kinase
MCSDGQGSLWLFAKHHLWERRQGKFIEHPRPAGEWGGCDRAPDGSVWMTTSKGLWRTLPGSGPPMLITYPFAGRTPGAVFEDSKRRLWVTSDEDICQAPTASLRGELNVRWVCQTIKGARSISKPVELSDGSLWAGTNMLGVWRYTEDSGWRVIRSSSALVSQSIAKLALSPSGGVWVLGMTARIRVLPRPDLPGGWEVVEELSHSQGIPAVRLYDLIEDTDGSLWVATQNGVAHLPPGARYAKLELPRVKLVGLLVNGERVVSTAAPRIPAGRNQIELQFAALSYRDRSLLRYQYKLHPNDAWTESTGSAPLFRFFDLRSGKYAVEIRASLDGINWSNVPARISFEVLAPWYFSWWAIALYLASIAIVLLLAHRLRVRVLLQMERQRTRIAMDLHDEIGSGLGSIGILSNVAASKTVDEGQRQEMSKRIAETAEELGASLTDIVWSLRADATTLESLGVHLARRAESLFANNQTQFTTKFPDEWPAISLSLAARRNIFLIAMESLHNAAKHSQAGNVALQFEQSDGRKWLMQIEDDGCGVSNDGGIIGSGMGMLSIRRRAEEIGAELRVDSRDVRGTIVSLTFNPQAKDHG